MSKGACGQRLTRQDTTRGPRARLQSHTAGWLETLLRERCWSCRTGRGRPCRELGEGRPSRLKAWRACPAPGSQDRSWKAPGTWGLGVAWARCSQVRVSCFRCSALKRPLWLWNLLGVDRSPHPEYHRGCLAQGLRVMQAHGVILELLTGRTPHVAFFAPRRCGHIEPDHGRA